MTERYLMEMDKKALGLDNCSGCYACVNVCPRDAITMNICKEGFWYPSIDGTRCIDCGACEKVCPVLHEKEGGSFNIAYAAYAIDKDIRLKSSSGGMFFLLARVIISRGGIVYGAAFSDDFLQVCHIRIDDIRYLYKLQGSKYLQSRIGNVFRDIKEDLTKGRCVLFTGTPCQVEGLILYLGKNYENLYTQDLICHGVPSPDVWKKYLGSRKIIDKAEPSEVNFRDKKNGWRDFELSIQYENSEFSESHHSNPYMKAFLTDCILRESCHQCSAKKMKRLSDITLADFWKIERVISDFDTDNAGTSLIILHSEKGKELFAEIEKDICCREVQLEQALEFNRAYFTSAVKNKNREKFFDQIHFKSVDELAKKYCETPVMTKLKWKFTGGVKKLRKVISKCFVFMIICLLLLTAGKKETVMSSKKTPLCVQTEGTDKIEITFQNEKLKPGKDLFLYIRTNKSIKGRKLALNNGCESYDFDNEVAFINDEGFYCYQYLLLSYPGDTITGLSIEDLPSEDIQLTCRIEYDKKIYEMNDGYNRNNDKELRRTENKLLTEYHKIYDMSDADIEDMVKKDHESIKQKWAETLGIPISQVNKYIDQNNVKSIGRLHKNGQVLADSSGKTIALNGVSLFHIPDYSYMYNEDTLGALKLWGINCIRIPAYLQFRISSDKDTVTRVERGLDTAYDEIISEMDRIIETATKEGLYCIIDFHILKEDGDILQYKELAEKFFTHFCEKYSLQDNILYEVANEPFGTDAENLTTYITDIKALIQSYDRSAVIISGHSGSNYNIGDVQEFYNDLCMAGIHDVFVSRHYYRGEDIEEWKKLYDAGVPLVFTEWSNADTDDLKPYKRFDHMTKQYLEWWNEKNIMNVVFMYCHGDYAFSLWKDVENAEQLLSRGLAGEEYLTDNGVLVFHDYLEFALERIKEGGIKLR